MLPSQGWPGQQCQGLRMLYGCLGVWPEDAGSAPVSSPNNEQGWRGKRPHPRVGGEGLEEEEGLAGLTLQQAKAPPLPSCSIPLDPSAPPVLASPAVAGDGAHVQVVVREGVDPRTQPLVPVLVHGVQDVHDVVALQGHGAGVQLAGDVEVQPDVEGVAGRDKPLVYVLQQLPVPCGTKAWKQRWPAVGHPRAAPGMAPLSPRPGTRPPCRGSSWVADWVPSFSWLPGSSEHTSVPPYNRSSDPEPKFALLAAGQANTLLGQERGIPIFNQKASRPRRWQTRVSKKTPIFSQAESGSFYPEEGDRRGRWSLPNSPCLGASPLQGRPVAE